MTDKVIIDGIDVAECVYALIPKKQCPEKSMYYAKETSCIACKEHNTKLNFCKNNPSCYYKQLKRLEAENAELKAENERLLSWLASSEKQKKELCNVIHKKKEQIQTMKYMLFDE